MKLFWPLLFLLIASTSAFPLFSFSLSDEPVAEAPVAIHHRHKKHHTHHKHRRRSLSSKEDAKARRNKQVMLTKPYWPWP